MLVVFGCNLVLVIFKLAISIVAENIARKQVLQEFSESRITFVESSSKAVWISLKALRNQDGFR